MQAILSLHFCRRNAWLAECYSLAGKPGFNKSRFTRKNSRPLQLCRLMTKQGLSPADLVPREIAEAWLKYLREELPTVAFKCSTQKQAVNLGQRRASKHVKGSRSRASRQKAAPSLAMQGSDSLGAEALLQLLKNYTRNSDIKIAITVGKFPFLNSQIWLSCYALQ